MSHRPMHAANNPGNAQKLRQTDAGRAELRAGLLAQLAHYSAKGDAQRADECRRDLEALA